MSTDTAIAPSLAQSILTLLLFDKENSSLIRNSLDVDSWTTDRGVGELVKYAYTYFDTYKMPLGVLHAYDAIKDLPLDKDSQELLTQLVGFCETNMMEINIPFVLTKIEKFHRQAVWKKILPDLVSLNESGDFDKLESLVSEASKKRLKVFDPGSKLSDTIGRLLLKDDTINEKDRVTLGIPALDERNVVPARGKLFVLAAAAKKGKSFAVVHIGKRALVQGKKVLHITLEMDEDETNGRYIQTIFGLTQRQGNAAKELNRVHIRTTGFDVIAVPPVKEISHDTLFGALDRLTSETYLDENLLVKAFPSGTLTINQLKAFMDNLEMQQGFVPDVLLIDYADLFDLSSEFQREELNKIYVQLKGIAAERNIIVVTVSQINREGARNKRASSMDVAEAWGKTATCDIFLVYNQTDLEHELNLGRLYVSDSRSTESKFEVLISQDYSTSNFCLTSQYLDRGWRDKLKDLIKSYSGDSD